MSAEEIANAFVHHYYTAFDGGPDALAGLYQAQSMLTFEGQQFQGSAAIIEKLKAVGQVAHNVGTIDIQPSTDSNAIIVFVAGSLRIGGDNPLHFSQMFQLVATAPGQYYVHNDIFRLNYGL
mmetsp:Transcript_104407/g.239106  ORF Transcript_104407/g.239106 Transcript_104407/m.239106 type:complete len:122 (-) Transcript_104407:224-589(-)